MVIVSTTLLPRSYALALQDHRPLKIPFLYIVDSTPHATNRVNPFITTSRRRAQVPLRRAGDKAMLQSQHGVPVERALTAT